MKIRYALVPLVLAGAIASPFVTTIVPQGHVGAVYDKMEKGVQDEVLTEGFHFKAPWQKVKAFPTSIETIYMSADEREGSEGNEEVTVGCSDGSLKADLTFSYRFKAEDVPEVQRNYRGKSGEEIMNNVLRGQLRTWVGEVTKNYSTMEVHLTKKDEVNTKLTEYLTKKAERYGVTFENVALAETRPSTEVQQAIERRQQIAQELEQQKLSLEKAEVAKKEEKLKQEKALIQAEGERKANEEKAKGLDERILKQMAIEKWDGKLPTVTSGTAVTNLK